MFVYAADSDGVVSEPVQTLLGLGRQDRFGKQVHVRDMTQDGIPDSLSGLRSTISRRATPGAYL